MEQGHWLLSKLGKRVLRPGGKELTLKMLHTLKINRHDDVIEFAPGIGFTASKILEKFPHSYTGIEINEEAAEKLKSKLKGANIVNAGAQNVPLPSSSADKIIGEAMLTMQADHRKKEIIDEAHRLLKPGGLYAIHELGLLPDEIDSQLKADIQRSLAQSIRVNARPLTVSEWSNLMIASGFEIAEVLTNDMRLLEPVRVLQDEGIFRTIRIGYNFLTHKEEARRVKEMRTVFNKYANHLNAVAIIAKKKS